MPALRASIFFWSTQGFTLGYYMKALRAIAKILIAQKGSVLNYWPGGPIRNSPGCQPWVIQNNIQARRADIERSTHTRAL